MFSLGFGTVRPKTGNGVIFLQRNLVHDLVSPGLHGLLSENVPVAAGFGGHDWFCFGSVLGGALKTQPRVGILHCGRGVSPRFGLVSPGLGKATSPATTMFFDDASKAETD